MNWYWRVRIYNTESNYFYCQIMTDRVLSQIEAIQDFYATMTGCKILLEGMSERPFEGIITIQETFKNLWIHSAKRGDA